MIRRELKMIEGPAWLLVSQVEHARLSAELARHWIAPGSEGVVCDADRSNDVPRQALAAIEHHDDGWDRWERAPEIDPKHGGPLSYRGEVALDKVLVIWSDSIASARQHGPLAGWMVARHFLYLLEGSESNASDAAQKWRETMESNCATWLSEWQAADSRHTEEVARRAVSFLQLFDSLSLWLCCDCPIPGRDPDESLPCDSFRSHSPSGDLGSYQFTPLPAASAQLMPGHQRETINRRVVVNPFPFDVRSLSLGARGAVVPRLPSMHWRQMAADSTPFHLAWEFVASPWSSA